MIVNYLKNLSPCVSTNTGRVAPTVGKQFTTDPVDWNALVSFVNRSRDGATDQIGRNHCYLLRGRMRRFRPSDCWQSRHE